MLSNSISATMSDFKRGCHARICLWVCAGPLPWDLLSESSEEGLTPRERQSRVAEEEEQKPAEQAAANGNAVQKAPAPDAKGLLTARTMSIADQLATGLLTAGEHLQAGSLPYCAF